MALPLVLFALLFLSMAIAFVAMTWRADLASIERQRDELHLVALTDAGIAMARSRLRLQPGFLGDLETTVGQGTVRVEVATGYGSWRRTWISVHHRTAARVTVVDFDYHEDGPLVIGWLPEAVAPR